MSPNRLLHVSSSALLSLPAGASYVPYMSHTPERINKRRRSARWRVICPIYVSCAGDACRSHVCHMSLIWHMSHICLMQVLDPEVVEVMWEIVEAIQLMAQV